MLSMQSNHSDLYIFLCTYHYGVYSRITICSRFLLFPRFLANEQKFFAIGFQGEGILPNRISYCSYIGWYGTRHFCYHFISIFLSSAIFIWNWAKWARSRVLDSRPAHLVYYFEHNQFSLFRFLRCRGSGETYHRLLLVLIVLVVGPILWMLHLGAWNEPFLLLFWNLHLFFSFFGSPSVLLHFLDRHGLAGVLYRCFRNEEKIIATGAYAICRLCILFFGGSYQSWVDACARDLLILILMILNNFLLFRFLCITDFGVFEIA